MDKVDLELRKRQAEFLKRKYLDKINLDQNPGISQNDFAEWLGLSAMTLSRAITGRSLLNLENCITASKQLGPEIFDACGYPRLELDDPKYRQVSDRLRARWNTYSKEQQDIIIENINEIIDNVDKPAADPRPAALQAVTVPA